ncbi:hypothetical protein D7Y13_36925 [Corallococcus praedator]|uniref:Secreted protein n=1 Tax=Corallococcus praedator TaxID=2316724 RepID=A0ABX9Q5X8_9BACT|nr:MULTISPECIES: hypothetical protein [Corallococcus]RKH00598.1 hypothetical protein D7X74_38435 [Corallococcus sp. CA047B]RKH33743.1 hypothetical protein D7X75_10840 [Corallococcus sp. CA031C]RKH92391.1 hypothetical protein D7Y13_36925 [Corallococcus praedator]
MRTLMKSLLTFSAVLSLAPMTAFALPPQCDDICWSADCDTPCGMRNRWSTCGAWDPGLCVGAVTPSEPSASVTPDEARDAEQVCSEENPTAEQAVTAGS